jgi:thymidylate kinase
MLVCLTGIDGAGKTTLAKEIVRSLRQDVYARYVPLLLRPFMLLGERLFLRGLDPHVDYSDYLQTKKEATGQRRVLALAYQSMLMMDYFLQVLVKVCLPMIRGQNVVCDRYVYDTVANDLAIDFNYCRRSIDVVLDWWMRFVPTPHLAVLVDVPEELACGRKSDIPSVEYVKERRPLYHYMARRMGMLTLDGSKDLSELRAVVCREVLKRLSDNGS